jgi:hypothetical protein
VFNNSSWEDVQKLLSVRGMKVRLFTEGQGDYLTRLDVEKKILFANKDRLNYVDQRNLEQKNGGTLTEDLI